MWLYKTKSWIHGHSKFVITQLANLTTRKPDKINYINKPRRNIYAIKEDLRAIERALKAPLTIEIQYKG